MNASTITTTGTFRISVTVGGAAVLGAFNYDAASKTALFAPIATLAAGTQFTAAVTTAAQSAQGSALAANYVWSFTTGLEVKASAPFVTSADPAGSDFGWPGRCERYLGVPDGELAYCGRSRISSQRHSDQRSTGQECVLAGGQRDENEWDRRRHYGGHHHRPRWSHVLYRQQCSDNHPRWQSLGAQCVGDHGEHRDQYTCSIRKEVTWEGSTDRLDGCEARISAQLRGDQARSRRQQ